MTEKKDNPLSEEQEYYQSIEQELLSEYSGQHALIKGDHLIGCYDTELDAYKVGIDMFGMQPFLLQEILVKERIIYIPSVFHVC